MTKIKAAVFEDVKQLEVKEIDRPVIRPDEVLVKLKACALCTWEQRVYVGSTKFIFHLSGVTRSPVSLLKQAMKLILTYGK